MPATVGASAIVSLERSPLLLKLADHCNITAHRCQRVTSAEVFSALFVFFITQPVDWEETLASLNVDKMVGETEWAKPGTKAGLAMLESFIDVRLKLFGTQRNDPNAPALSQLSPWIRFGQ